MLDINAIRENTEAVRAALLKRMDAVDFTELLDWDKQRRALISESEALKAKKNTVSKQIPQMRHARVIGCGCESLCTPS